MHETEVTIVVNPVGGRGLHLGTSQFVRCAREHQWSGGRLWVAVWQVPCCAGHVGDFVALELQREHKGQLCGKWNPAGRPRGSPHTPWLGQATESQHLPLLPCSASWTSVSTWFPNYEVGSEYFPCVLADGSFGVCVCV